MFNIDGPQILGATVHNLVVLATLRPGFLHPCALYCWLNAFSFIGFTVKEQTCMFFAGLWLISLSLSQYRRRHKSHLTRFF